MARWEVTGRCQRRCKYCSANGLRSAADSPVIIAERLAECGISEVGLLGGEPLLHTRIGEILRVFGRAGVSVTINTNGLLLCSEDAIRRISDLCAVSFIISIDSFDPGINDYLRGKGAFDSAWNALQHLVRLQAKGDILGVACAVTLTRLNSNGLHILVRRLSEIGVGHCFVNRVYKSGSAGQRWSELGIGHEDFLQTLAVLFREALPDRYLTINPGLPLIGQYLGWPKSSSWSYFCRDGVDSFDVCHDGRAYPSRSLAPMGVLRPPLYPVDPKCDLVRFQFYTVWASMGFVTFRQALERSRHAPLYKSCQCCHLFGNLCLPSPAGYLWGNPNPYELCSFILAKGLGQPAVVGSGGYPEKASANRHWASLATEQRERGQQQVKVGEMITCPRTSVVRQKLDLPVGVGCVQVTGERSGEKAGILSSDRTWSAAVLGDCLHP